MDIVGGTDAVRGRRTGGRTVSRGSYRVSCHLRLPQFWPGFRWCTKYLTPLDLSCQIDYSNMGLGGTGKQVLYQLDSLSRLDIADIT